MKQITDMLCLSGARLLRTTLGISIVVAPIDVSIVYAAAIDNTATASGVIEGGGPIDSLPASETVITIDANPSILVTKSAVLNDTDGSGGLSDGDTISYEITVENDGNLSVENLVLTDTFEQDGTPLAFDSGPTLEEGDDADSGVLNVDETWTYRASYTVQQSNIDNTSPIENNALFEGDVVGGLTVEGEDDASIEMIGVTSIDVAKAAVSTSYARAGDVIEWAITVTNDGTTTLTAITVTDNLADSVVCPTSTDATIASLGPDEFEVCSAFYEIQPDDVDAETLTNVAGASGNGGGLSVSAQGNAEISREGANLVTVKTVSPADTAPLVGGIVTYQILVTNEGSAEATDITLTDLLPVGLTATANNGDASVGTYDDVSGLWEIASLANGESATLTLEGVVDAGQGDQVITNIVSAAESNEYDPTTDGDNLIAIVTPVQPPATSGLSIQKTAGTATARLGETVNYTITITNDDPGDFLDVSVIDTLPAGLVYTPNSATIDGTPTEPDVSGRILTFSDLIIPGNDSVEIDISARIGGSISGQDIVNNVYATGLDGRRVTNTAQATIQLEVDPVFACSTIIGRVFDDKNRNGVQDAETSPYAPEPGLAGVRLSTVNGLLITTDEFGRFSVPCADIPDADIGSNYILKLDTRSLPTGYRVTTENPRAVRITQGKMVTLNFGAAVSRSVNIDLSGTAFNNGSKTPSNALVGGIDQLVAALETEPSVLRLTYYENGEGVALAKQRLAEVEKLVRQRLRRSQLGVDLWIETRILKR